MIASLVINEANIPRRLFMKLGFKFRMADGNKKDRYELK